MKKEFNINHIPNPDGRPIYDEIGEKLRDFLQAWRDADYEGLNLEPSGELAGIISLTELKSKPTQLNGVGLAQNSYETKS